MTDIIIVKNTLKDYSAWRVIFDGNKEKQGEFGIHIRNIYQTKEDPNTCFIVADIDDMERAQGFIKQIKDSGLQEKAGVLTSETTFCTDVTYHLDIQDIWQMNIE